MNEEGKTVAGVEVTAFLEGQRVDRVMKTNESGQFRVPRSWCPDDPHDSHAMLLVRQGDSRLGWLNLRKSPEEWPRETEAGCRQRLFPNRTMAAHPNGSRNAGRPGREAAE